jgi:hypothetical protein
MIYDTSNGIYAALEAAATRLLKEHDLDYAPTDVVDAVLRQPEMREWAKDTQNRLDDAAKPAFEQSDGQGEAGVSTQWFDYEDRRLREQALVLSVQNATVSPSNTLETAEAYLTFLKGGGDGAS